MLRSFRSLFLTRLFTCALQRVGTRPDSIASHSAVSTRAGTNTPSIFFRIEIRDEYEAGKREGSSAVYRSGQTVPTNKRNEPATSTQKSHLRLSRRRKPASQAITVARAFEISALNKFHRATPFTPRYPRSDTSTQGKHWDFLLLEREACAGAVVGVNGVRLDSAPRLTARVHPRVSAPKTSS